MGNESNLLLQAKYFGPGKIAYFSSGFHFYVQVKNVFIQERASSIQKFWSFRSLCSIKLEYVSCDQISHHICINLGLSFCGQNFQVMWRPSSEAIEYRMQSLVNWNNDEYILCSFLFCDRAPSVEMDLTWKYRVTSEIACRVKVNFCRSWKRDCDRLSGGSGMASLGKQALVGRRERTSLKPSWGGGVT